MDILLQYNGGANANDLNNNNTVLRFPTLSADSQIGLILSSETAPLTAFVTAVSFTQTPNYDGGFIPTVYNFNNATTLPFKLTNLASGTRTQVEVSLSALGFLNSKGRQDGNFVVTLSSHCLSGGAGASSVVRTTVDNSPVSVFTSLTAAVTPVGNAPYSIYEYTRLRLLGYI